MSQITKRALEQSLKNLLLRKPLNKITISDIAEDCGINRMTFYYHSGYLWPCGVVLPWRRKKSSGRKKDAWYMAAGIYTDF